MCSSFFNYYLYKSFYKTVLLLNTRYRWFPNNACFKKIIYNRIRIKLLKIGLKDAYSNSILLFQKCYQSLKCSKSFRLFLKKLYLYIVSCFINKKNKIVKSIKYSISILIPSNISIYLKSEDDNVYSKFLI